MPRPSPRYIHMKREVEHLTEELKRANGRLGDLVRGIRPEMEAKVEAMAAFAERAKVAEEGQRSALLHCDKLQNEKARFIKLYEYEAQKSKHLNRVIDGLQLFIEKFANTCALDAHPFWNNTAKPE